ncbi:MAG: prevent-host-death protein [Propionibacteriaceae bacterium]|jgi:antitoxin (DNA-binding transcriptional repressor) of toxin-antitoxin stability system|nr:prevent-host-death protein [Propionibacteriaceae bacterium]
MSTITAISQRDLRLRSKEIMDGVEAGTEFVVTRDGRPIGELIPLRQHQQFVSRRSFAALSAGAPVIDLDRFRRDLEMISDDVDDPYAR